MKDLPQKYFLADDGVFPNSKLPVLHYKEGLDLPTLFAAKAVKKLFTENGWGNCWRSGIYTYQHYHSNAHEVLGICKGATTVMLGGENGIKLRIKRGDVLVIPAGVAHKNLGQENDVVCVGAYANSKDFDICYGKTEERPETDRRIAKVSIPKTDPAFGDTLLPLIWKNVIKAAE